MANFAELSCFNKLLLDKMKRMEQKHKEEMKKLQKLYDSLMEETIINGYCENVHYCDKCEEWFNSEYDDDCVGDYDVGWCCGACVDQGLCTLFNCENCGECFTNDKINEDYMKKINNGLNGDLCNICHKSSLVCDLMENNGFVGTISEDYANKIVYKRNELMKELLKKVKTN